MKISHKNEELAALLKTAGFRVTHGALAVLEVLSGSSRPLTVQDIEKKLGKNLNTATVYRMLERLKKAGIIRHVDFLHGHAHYEMNDKDHHHLVCSICTTVEELEGCMIEDLERKVAKSSKTFLSVTGHSLEFFGVCKKCATRKAL